MHRKSSEASLRVHTVVGTRFSNKKEYSRSTEGFQVDGRRKGWVLVGGAGPQWGLEATDVVEVLD